MLLLLDRMFFLCVTFISFWFPKGGSQMVKNRSVPGFCAGMAPLSGPVFFLAHDADYLKQPARQRPARQRNDDYLGPDYGCVMEKEMQGMCDDAEKVLH